jgi:hypothetical protein
MGRSNLRNKQKRSGKSKKPSTKKRPYYEKDESIEY